MLDTAVDTVCKADITLASYKIHGGKEEGDSESEGTQ